MLIIWGLRVVYRTLGRGVFFCRRCGGDRDYRHRAGRRYITIFFIPLIPLTTTGEHVQCLTCKTRYVTEVLKLPTTVQMQVALVAGMRAMVAIILRAGDPASPLSRRRALDTVTFNVLCPEGGQTLTEVVSAQNVAPGASAQFDQYAFVLSEIPHGRTVVPGVVIYK